MSSRTFRLATVLRVRRIQEEMARAEVAKARLDVARAEEEAETLAARASATGPPPTGDASSYLAAVTAGLALARDAATARGAVAEVETVAEERHDEWRQAAARVKPLERLEEAHRDAVRAADDRAAQAANDEIAGARHETDRRRATQKSKEGNAATGG